MQVLDIILIVVAVAAVILVGLFFLNQWASKKMAEQQRAINATKMTQSVYIIDKKKEKLENAHMPKMVMEQVPKYLKFKKMPLVKVKVGPQIMTLICDPKVYDELPLKKQVKVEIAGIYIISVKGAKAVPAKKKSFIDKIKGKFSKKEDK